MARNDTPIRDVADGELLTQLSERREELFNLRFQLVTGQLDNSARLGEVKRTIARRTLVLGLQHLSRADLERALAAGEMLQIQVVGLARIADDVSPELARATIESVVVLGAFQASAAVRSALADRMR